MKKITILLIAFVAFCWQGHAQVLTEGFETGAIPAGWTLEYVSGTSDWTYVAQNGDASITPRTGSYMAEFRNGTSGTATKLVTSALDVTTLTNPQLTFYYANVNWFGDIDELRVFYKSSAAGAWTQIGIDYTAEQAAWTEVRLLLPNPSNDYYIAFEAASNWARGLNLDDVLVDEGPACVSTVVDSSTVVDDCGSSQFSVDVVVSSVGDGTVITDGIGGSFTVSASTVTAGPYAIGDTIILTVEHSDNACNFSLGSFQTACTLPGTDCSNPINVGVLPYTTTDNTSNYGDIYGGSPGASGCGSTSNYLNGDDVVYAYTAVADTSINVSMTPTATYSGIFVYTDCADIGVNCVAGVANTGTTERNFDLTVTNGTTYYFVISTWAAPQSTAYTLNITENTCTAVTAAFNVVNDCDVSGTGGFFIGVNVTDMGSASDLTVSDNQGNAAQTLAGVGTLQFGPYVNATDVVITIDDDNDDDSCTVTSSILTQLVCPPANDECTGAIGLTVNADYACGVVTSGTVLGATNSGVDNCQGVENDDVWYSFTATNARHRVSILNRAGSPTDMMMAFYDATPGCGALGTQILCSDPETANLTGLNIGTTYFVQVYTYSGSSGSTTTFDICVGTPPPPPANETCATATTIACGDSISGTSESSNGTQEGSGCTMGINGVWYTFTGYGGDITINVSASFDHELAITSGTCGALVNIACEDSFTGPESYTITDTIDGETYYVYIANWSGSSTTTGTHTIALTCPTVSVDDFASSDVFTYYPNPVNNTLSLKGVKTIQDVAVYNMLGQQVLRTAPNTVNSDVDMSNLQAGTYFVKVTIENATKTIKVIKK